MATMGYNNFPLSEIQNIIEIIDIGTNIVNGSNNIVIIALTVWTVIK